MTFHSGFVEQETTAEEEEYQQKRWPRGRQKSRPAVSRGGQRNSGGQLAYANT